jgi:LysR family transcriptional regulator, low CO2-responsive transcriptional regulator
MSALRGLTLNQLRIFAAASKHLHFGRAAAELHVSQPAVSIQLKQLETAIGLPLFEQIGRRMHLTPAGAEFAKHAREVLARLHEADEAIDALKGTGAGEIHIASTTTAEYFVPRLLADFRRGHPRVKIRLTVQNRERVVRALGENSVDLVIMGKAPREFATIATTFSRNPLGIIASPEHPLADRRRVKLSQLDGDTFLIRERGSGTRDAMERVFAAQQFRPAETAEIGSNETIKQAVMAGMGVSFLSLHTVGLELATRKLTVLHVLGTPVMRDWYVIHRKGKRLSLAASTFRNYLVKEGSRAIQRALG